jgi:hypothetical protein
MALVFQLADAEKLHGSIEDINDEVLSLTSGKGEGERQIAYNEAAGLYLAKHVCRDHDQLQILSEPSGWLGVGKHIVVKTAGESSTVIFQVIELFYDVARLRRCTRPGVYRSSLGLITLP